jgi:predicted phage terminase large subunit-like protein
MASQKVLDSWDNYTSYFGKYRDIYLHARDEGDMGTVETYGEKLFKVVSAMIQACEVVFSADEEQRDLVFGKEIGYRTIDYINEAVYLMTTKNLPSFQRYKAPERGRWRYISRLEDYAQEKKEPQGYVEMYYRVLWCMSPHYTDAFKLYIERDRRRKDRFYEPRRRTLIKISDAVQKLENDELDVLFIHCPPRTGKSGEITMDVAWHCARDTELSNLYVTYKEGLGGAFLDGVQEIYTDPTYRFADTFPKVKITSTDAKNNKLDLGTDGRRRKKYKSLSGKGLESGLNGEYDASGWLIVDDPLEGVQDVMSKEVLKRKQEIFNNNVLSRAKEKCKLLFIGTIWDEHDIFSTYKEFLELNKGDLRVEEIKIPALDPDTDESNFVYDFGVGFSTEHFRRIRAKFELSDDMVGWLAQYQQSPIAREGAVFKPDSMNYFSELPSGEVIKKVAHCDVALGGGDYLSFPIAYYFENPDGSLTGYVTDVVFDNAEKHVTQPQVLWKIKKHELKNVHFESNQGGEGYKDDIVRLLGEDKEYKVKCNISSSWAPVTKRKEQRIWDCAQQIRELYFLVPEKRDAQYRKFMQNLFSFTLNMKKRDHDDAPDSLAGLIEFAENGSGVRTTRIVNSPI